MRLFHPVPAIVLAALCCSFVSAKEHLLRYDEDTFTYELTFDDTRISLAQMREIACLSPWTSYCKPFFGIGLAYKRNGKTETIYKSLTAPTLEDCVAGRNTGCTTDAKIPDAAFLRNALVNLHEGTRQIDVFRKRPVPPVLASIKATLLASLERSLEKQQALYAYLKSGDLAQIRAILCAVCNCGAQESALLEHLRTPSDPHTRLTLSRYDWQNRVVACENAHQPPYPMDKWQQFLKEYSIVERRRTIQID
jgi:hypothetical protein